MGPPVTYIAANDALNDVFFGGRFAGQPVYLTLDNQMSVEVARALNIKDPDGVEDAICEAVGSYLSQRGDPYNRALLDLKSWSRDGARVGPPCTAILFALSHAASLMAGDGEFGASNYYDRLAGVLGIEKQHLSIHGKSTDILWSALNQWLLVNNFAHGRPTARAINTWTYVSKAMSQAVVRAGDRHYFHALFERYGFSGNEIIQPREMEYYLSHWMLTSEPNQRLRNAWKEKELRDRISETAIAELISWALSPERTSQGGVARPSRLLLIANLVPKFPRQALELHLGRMGEEGQHDGLNIDGQGNFTLAADRFPGFATINPPVFGSDASSLTRSYAFEPRGGGTGFEWQPRLIVPFAKPPGISQWTEVARVSFGLPHLLLVRDTKGLPRDVEFFLADAGISQPSRATSDELPGLPNGWVLYGDVQVGQPSFKPRDDLSCLVPLADDGVLSTQGGLRLMQDFFHVGVPMDASFIATTGPTRIEARPYGAKLTSAPVVVASSDNAQCKIEIDPKDFIEAGGASIVALQDDKIVEATDVFFRDANKPNPRSHELRDRLAYRSVLSAALVDGDALEVEGLQVRGILPPLANDSNLDGGDLPEGAEEVSQEASLSNMLDMHVSRDTCVQRDYHYWKCEMLPHGKPRRTPLEQRCKDCGLSLIIVDRGRKQAKVQQSISIRPMLPREHMPSAGIDPDILLDALCFHGNGSWGRFLSLLDADGVQAMNARQLAQDLFLLGFLDLELRSGSNSIKAWSVPAPSLVYVSSGRGFLSGFRCDSLLVQLEDIVEGLGGNMRRNAMPDRPAMISIDGVEEKVLREASANLRDPLGRRFIVVGDAASKITRACGGLDGMTQFLRPVSIGRARNLQRFDVKQAKWDDVGLVSSEGAYRWNDGAQSYAYVAPSGQMSSGPYQVIKLLAARGNGFRLHNYDRAKEQFLSTLGCDPPGLLGRALVACSGTLPEMQRGVVAYTGVGKDVALGILSHLYPANSNKP